ncbi:MAG: DUF1272 domain-containing protein [Acidobacteriota bacterium]
MALSMKTRCQRCDARLEPADVAYICSHECTYCPTCADAAGPCPGCGGELVPRPRRGPLEDGSSMTVEGLRGFGDDWGRGDVEALMSWMTDDCVYGASVGPEPGTTFTGRSEVEEGFRRILAYEDGGGAESGPIHLFGHRAIAEWSYLRPGPDGRPLRVRGCDLFEMEGRRIRRKDAFIKTLPMASPT